MGFFQDICRKIGVKNDARNFDIPSIFLFPNDKSRAGKFKI